VTEFHFLEDIPSSASPAHPLSLSHFLLTFVDGVSHSHNKSKEENVNERETKGSVCQEAECLPRSQAPPLVSYDIGSWAFTRPNEWWMLLASTKTRIREPCGNLRNLYSRIWNHSLTFVFFHPRG